MPKLEPESESPHHDTIRLVIVDDHPLFREATIAALQSDPHIRILGEGSNATDAGNPIWSCSMSPCRAVD
jgi:hypothetical protein